MSSQIAIRNDEEKEAVHVERPRKCAANAFVTKFLLLFVAYRTRVAFKVIIYKFNIKRLNSLYSQIV